jgi:hypothetical protein
MPRGRACRAYCIQAIILHPALLCLCDDVRIDVCMALSPGVRG